MNKTMTGPRWSTSSFSEAPDVSMRDVSALGEHLNLCRALSGRRFALLCAAEALAGFAAARVVTTVVAAMLVIAASLQMM
jgi:hypothetical protein